VCHRFSSAVKLVVRFTLRNEMSITYNLGKEIWENKTFRHWPNSGAATCLSVSYCGPNTDTQGYNEIYSILMPVGMYGTWAVFRWYLNNHSQSSFYYITCIYLISVLLYLYIFLLRSYSNTQLVVNKNKLLPPFLVQRFNWNAILENQNEEDIRLLCTSPRV